MSVCKLKFQTCLASRAYTSCSGSTCLCTRIQTHRQQLLVPECNYSRKSYSTHQLPVVLYGTHLSVSHHHQKHQALHDLNKNTSRTNSTCFWTRTGQNCQELMAQQFWWTSNPNAVPLACVPVLAGSQISPQLSPQWV